MDFILNALMALALVAAFAAADFIDGRDFIKNLGLPGRSIWYVAPALALLMVVFGLQWVGVVLVWAIWRSVLGWAQFNGRMDVKTLADAGAMMGRDVCSIIPSVVAFPLLFGTPWSISVGGWLLFCLSATIANAGLGKFERPGVDVDAYVDGWHGLTYGATAAALVMVSHH